MRVCTVIECQWSKFFIAALDYFKSNPGDMVDKVALETHCGVGVVITPEEIAEEVRSIIGSKVKCYICA